MILPSARPICTSDYQAFLASFAQGLEFDAAYPYVLMTHFLRVAARHGRSVLTDDLRLEIILRENALPGPAFHCEMLVNTDCETPCDWDTAFGQSHDLSACENLSYEPLLGFDSDRVWAMPYAMTFTSFKRNKHKAP